MKTKCMRQVAVRKWRVSLLYSLNNVLLILCRIVGKQAEYERMDLSKPEYRKVSANVARCCPLLARSLTYLFNDFGGRDRPALFETSSLLRRAYT